MPQFRVTWMETVSKVAYLDLDYSDPLVAEIDEAATIDDVTEVLDSVLSDIDDPFYVEVAERRVLECVEE